MKSYTEALTLLNPQEFDLVQVRDSPPVVKIMPKAAKQQPKAAASNSASGPVKKKSLSVKELEINSTITDHDLMTTKLPKATEFLTKGHSLKLTVFERGNRQGQALMARLMTELKPLGSHGTLTTMGKKITVMFSSKSK